MFPRISAMAPLLLILLTVCAVARAQAPEARALQDAVSDYRIAPGDLLDIRVLGEDDLSTTTRVGNGGTIRIPFVAEDLTVACLTEREVESIVADRLRKYLKRPEVHVAVKEFVGKPVAVIGAVSQPGRFQLQRPVSLLELLVFAGGPNEKAGKLLHVINMSTISACESPAGGEERVASETVSLAKLMDGDVTQNRVMRAGDIVIVPQADLVFVMGEVAKPNAYPLREGLTLTQVLSLSGGATPLAKTGAVRIVRQEPGKAREELTLDLKAVQEGKVTDPLLMANDVVEVPGSGGKKFLNGFLSAFGGSIGQLPTRVVP